MNADPIFDGGDINDHGSWVGAEMGCLECHETTRIRSGYVAQPYLRGTLECGECGRAFSEYSI